MQKGAKGSITQDELRKIVGAGGVFGNYARKQPCCSLPNQMSLKCGCAITLPCLALPLQPSHLCRRGTCWGSLETKVERASLHFIFFLNTVSPLLS